MALPLNRSQPTPGLRASPVFGYIRKSKEEKDKQVMSLDKQREEIERFVSSRGWGKVDLWFSDEQSGKDFERPGFAKMMATVAANPQRGKPGRVIMLDYDRFARPVNKQLKVDDIEYQRQRVALHDAGFELDYAWTPKTGNATSDALMGAMKVAGSGEYIEKLAKNSRDGKRRVGMSGYWNGSMAPFPCERYAEGATFPLERGQRGPNGRVVLGKPQDLTKLQHWIDAAHMILAGKSYDQVGAEFNARGVPNFYGGDWRRGNFAKIFANPALIGEVEYTFTNDDGTQETFTGKARWEPIVPVPLFRAVRAEVEKRRASDKRARLNREYALTLECAYCGAKFINNTLKPCPDTGWKELRVYVHPSGLNMNEITRHRAKKAECKGWRVRADDAESAVRDLIIAQRGSKSFATAFIDLVEEQGAIESQTEQMEKDAERQVKMIERKRTNLRIALEDAEDDDTRDELLRSFTDLTRQLKDAQSVWKQARARREQGTELNDELLQLVEEAQHIKETWETSGEEGIEARRRIVDTWIDHVVVESKLAHKGRNSRRTLVVHLRTQPHTPMVTEIGPRPDGDDRTACAVTSSTTGPLAPQKFKIQL